MKSARAVVALCGLIALPARAQGTPQEAQIEQDDLTRPVTDLDIRYHLEDDTTKSQNDKHELIFRNNWRIDLAGSWSMGLRFDVPVIASDDGRTSTSEYQLGMGQFLAQAYLADKLNARWAYAFGGRITAPAASGTDFGSGNWQVNPLLGARVTLPEITEGSFFEPVFLYAQTFAQSFPGSSTSNLEAGPLLKVDLSGPWFVELYPTTDIRWNFGAKANGQTGRLFLPLDAEIGRTFGEALVTSLEISVPIVKDYPVYHLKIETRVAHQF